MIAAIWKDTNYQFSGSVLNYSIYDSSGGEGYLFKGRAYKLPSASSGEVNVSRIVQNYLYQIELPIEQMMNGSDSDSYTATSFTKEVELNDADENVLETYWFFADWSYDNKDYRTGSNNIDNPVNGHSTPSMFVFNNTLEYNREVLMTVRYDRGGDPRNEYNDSYCGDWALYYVNRYGGWDSYLIENGKVVEAEDFTRNTYETPINRTNTAFEREKHRYYTSSEKKWTVSTGLLNDAEARIMARHLFSSNMVYLHDLVNDIIYSVQVEDAGVTYKTFKNEQNVLEYSINLTGSSKEINLGR